MMIVVTDSSSSMLMIVGRCQVCWSVVVVMVLFEREATIVAVDKSRLEVMILR